MIFQLFLQLRDVEADLDIVFTFVALPYMMLFLGRLRVRVRLKTTTAATTLCSKVMRMFTMLFWKFLEDYADPWEVL